jgi:hypothetical protein
MSNCPRCKAAHDEELMQCPTCGEILQKTHYGTNQAAVLSSSTRAAAPRYDLGPEPILINPQALHRASKWTGGGSLAAGVLAVIAGFVALGDPANIGYEMLEAAILVGSAAGVVFVMSLLALLFSWLLTRMSAVLVRDRIERLAELEERLPGWIQRRRATDEVPVSRARTRVPGTPLFGWARGYAPSANLVPQGLSLAAVASFLALSQYRVADTEFSGIRALREIATGFVERDVHFASAESLIVVAIPLSLVALLALCLDSRFRSSLVAAVVSLALTATLFAVNVANMQFEVATSVKGFSYGFYAQAGLTALVLAALLLRVVRSSAAR